MTTISAAASVGRLRTTWKAAHVPAVGVPRWAWIAALTIPFTVLPSGLWRIGAVTLHLPIFDGEQGSGDLPAWFPLEVYVVVLTIASELLAFAAVGLVTTWGEKFPHWVPWLRGRRVPILAAVIPAVFGTIVLTLLWTTAATNTVLGRDIQGRPRAEDNPLTFDNWEGVLTVAAYAPLVMWGPLLGAVTVAYWRRRRGPAGAATRGTHGQARGSLTTAREPAPCGVHNRS